MKKGIAIFCVVAGLALLLLGAMGIRFALGIRPLPQAGIPLIFASLMTGALLVTLGTCRLVYGPLSARDGSGSGDFGYNGPSSGGSHGGDCGHAGGGFDGGGCGDGGGGH
jgi:uncharacterized membrane protein YgcG